MKLIVTVVQDQDSARLIDRLLEEGHRATKLASTGGFLKEGNTTLLIGVEESDLEDVIGIIREICKARKQLVTPLAAIGRSIGSFVPHPIEVPVGGATIFVLDVERFEKV